MKINRQAMTCGLKSCGKIFWGEIVVEAPVDVAIASMKAIRCPECGSKKVMIFMNLESYNRAEAALKMDEKNAFLRDLPSPPTSKPGRKNRKS